MNLNHFKEIWKMNSKSRIKDEISPKTPTNAAYLLIILNPTLLPNPAVFLRLQ